MNTCRGNILVPPLLFVPLGALSKLHAIPQVNLNPQTSDILAGDSFTVEVVVQGVTDIDPALGPDPIFAFGFNVTCSTEILFDQAVVGPDFRDDSHLFPDTQVAGSASAGVNGWDILLARLQFKTTVAGNFSVGIVSDLMNPDQGLLTCPEPLPYNMTQCLNIRVLPASQLVSIPEQHPLIPDVMGSDTWSDPLGK